MIFPSRMSTELTAAQLRDKLQALDDERTEIANRITNLQEQEKVQLNGRKPGCVLIDADGFPLTDVDVHAVRLIRFDLARAQGDYASTTDTLEKTMLAFHKQAMAEIDHEKLTIPTVVDPPKATNTSSPSSALDSSLIVLPEERTLSSLFWIRKVLSGSPADLAGFLVNDEVIAFNGRPQNGESVGAFVSEAVRSHIEMPIRVVIRRKPTESDQLHSLTTGVEEMNLRGSEAVIRLQSQIETKVFATTLTPRKWDGPGYLGCEIVPF